jgi:hypothetical protein
MWRNTKLWMCVLFAGTVIVWLATEVVDAQNEEPAEGPQTAESADNQEPDLPALRKEIEDLRAQVDDLRERVAQLEAPRGTRLLELQFTPDRVVPQSVPAPGLRGRAPQGEINGVPYYVIPVDEK